MYLIVCFWFLVFPALIDTHWIKASHQLCESCFDRCGLHGEYPGPAADERCVYVQTQAVVGLVGIPGICCAGRLSCRFDWGDTASNASRSDQYLQAHAFHIPFRSSPSSNAFNKASCSFVQLPVNWWWFGLVWRVEPLAFV